MSIKLKLKTERRHETEEEIQWVIHPRWFDNGEDVFNLGDLPVSIRAGLDKDGNVWILEMENRLVGLGLK